MLYINKRRMFNIIFLSILVAISFYLFNLHNILVASDNPEKADAILILSGGSVNRESEGARLFHEGYSDKIILTGAIRPSGELSSDIMKANLIKLGVPEEVIYSYKYVTSTREEALKSIDILNHLNVKKLILVTNKSHSARAKWIFKRILKEENIQVISCPVRTDTFERDWWKKRSTRRAAFLESIKFIWEALTLYKFFEKDEVNNVIRKLL